MKRLIVYIAVSLAITAAAAWLISLPGTVSIEISGYHLQPGLGLTAIALILLILISIAIWAIVRRLLEAPKRLAKSAQQRRRNRGVDALSDSFMALQAGDPQRARNLAREAQNRLPDNAAAQLLEARADLAIGDMVAAREHYRALISNPKTSLAALTGLYEQAEAQGRHDAALTFARKASALDPKLVWAGKTVFQDLVRNHDWQQALDMIATLPLPNRDDKTSRKHKQAVLHTAIAADNETTAPETALSAATAALKLEPSFVPAALISARLFINRGEKRKAASLLRRVWRATGHPDLATLFAHSQPGASAVERLKTLRQIIEPQPENREAACVLAQAAIDAYEWSAARNALAGFSANAPTQKICMLMAEIEEGQHGDQGKAREWLGRAVQAPRDPAWVANGMISDEWEPISPVTHMLDAFEWKIPTTALARPGPDVLANTEESLPPALSNLNLPNPLQDEVR